MARYTIQELSHLTGISVRSIRNYLHAYAEHLHPERGSCNALLFSEGDLEAFLRIRTLLREGRTRDEILALLARPDAGATIVIRRQDEAPPGPATGGIGGATTTAVAVVPESSGLLTRLDAQTELLKSLVDENRALRQRLEVIEVRLRLREGVPALPAAAAPRRIPVRSGALEIPMPYFLLRLKDGAEALGKALLSSLFPSRGAGSGEGLLDPPRA